MIAHTDIVVIARFEQAAEFRRGAMIDEAVQSVLTEHGITKNDPPVDDVFVAVMLSKEICAEFARLAAA